MFENLREMLTNNFENELLEEAINNLNSNSRIRFSNFAFVIRELIDVLLKNLATDENIENCGWYVEPQNSERKILRCHRIKYIIQGGFLENIFDLMTGINFNDAIGKINKYFRDELSTNVHLTKESLNYSQEEIIQKSKDFEVIIDEFLSMIRRVRQQIINFLVDAMEIVVNDAFLSETIDDLDILSTHTRIDNIDDIEFEINSISSNEIIGTITGTVNVFLQYGSDREVRDGLGDEIEASYPFILPFTIDIQPLNDLFNDLTQDEIQDNDFILESFIPDFRNMMRDNMNIDISNVSVNTDSFYE